jgi:hypothetical protein
VSEWGEKIADVLYRISRFIIAVTIQISMIHKEVYLYGFSEQLIQSKQQNL